MRHDPAPSAGLRRPDGSRHHALKASSNGVRTGFSFGRLGRQSKFGYVQFFYYRRFPSRNLAVGVIRLNPISQLAARKGDQIILVPLTACSADDFYPIDEELSRRNVVSEISVCAFISLLSRDYAASHQGWRQSLSLHLS